MNLSNKAQCNNNLFKQLQYQLEVVEIHNHKLARFLCQIIPSHCKFERTVTFHLCVS
ncbi:MAG: Mo-dependent nitrogenase C-terminal domain-containing protein [Nostoc sp. SerVER01]|uniref:Mo-dependent nitrogenase C-terminal domain-containing protein n=1 Tax=Nostoc sp. CCY 9925 TaxID=3103865 RepID=UPI002ADC0A8C|nr:Mo-dependent nitrogenase C-terminal domain-containing protein [Nostoc sp. SerVER01]MDZ8024597.1 Mo-dependent nitrogenase C-terminal domain-containing protein [Nostoc sp. DedQUE11]MDZ8071225.1 Mo-dependent nitrogenase C-terminal domain-containing protein [Nostoc sp. DedQUE01]MDZ8082369.1 Mo-dependent nitrogenase C-terminal domain-containing protein [Nostoc sp. DcaGUA01]MDZ8236122.1 Mo-dependent nitrogenase C-terminal domain-containing protein [Nostoc sp. ChiQUE01a]